MFDSLADKIKQDEREGVSTAKLAAKWTAIIALAVVLFGGLYYAVRLFG